MTRVPAGLLPRHGGGGNPSAFSADATSSPLRLSLYSTITDSFTTIFTMATVAFSLTAIISSMTHITVAVSSAVQHGPISRHGDPMHFIFTVLRLRLGHSRRWEPPNVSAIQQSNDSTAHPFSGSTALPFNGFKVQPLGHQSTPISRHVSRLECRPGGHGIHLHLRSGPGPASNARGLLRPSDRQLSEALHSRPHDSLRLQRWLSAVAFLAGSSAVVADSTVVAAAASAADMVAPAVVIWAHVVETERICGGAHCVLTNRD